MAKRIIWAESAEKELFKVLEYWKNVNQSRKYSSTIVTYLNTVTSILSQSHNSGKKTNSPEVQFKSFMSHFQILYTIRNKDLVILSFWDGRQDPDRNQYS